MKESAWFEMCEALPGLGARGLVLCHAKVSCARASALYVVSEVFDLKPTRVPLRSVNITEAEIKSDSKGSDRGDM